MVRWLWSRRAFFAFVVLAATNAAALFLVVNEASERRDQNCELFEADHLDDVKRLRGTYRYLMLPVAEQEPTLTKLVFAQLPMLEREASADQAPAYCDEEGVGLPEPDPKVPERPEVLR